MAILSGRGVHAQGLTTVGIANGTSGETLSGTNPKLQKVRSEEIIDDALIRKVIDSGY